MKIHIDRDGCIECGACEAECNEVFQLKNGEKASVVERYQTLSPADGEVGNELTPCAEGAAEVCPVAVISTE